MRAPRVLLLVDQLGGGGTERQLVHLLRGTRGRIEAHCHVLNAGGVWENEVRRLSAGVQYARHASPVRRGLELLHRIRELRPDVVHSWHSYVCVYPLVSKALHRRPVVASLRGDVTVNDDTGAREFPAFYRLLRFADVVVANGDPALRAVERQGVRYRRSCVIRNGIEPGPGPTARASGETVRVLGLGRLHGVKNWSQLLRVSAALRRRGTPVSLSILGEGPDRPQLERQCRELGLDPAETLPGYRGDIAPFLARADLLVHTSRSEGSPNAVLEGLAAGLPVVVSDLEVCRDLARGGDFVRLFPVDDDEACAQHVGWLARHADERRAMGESARRFVEREFSCSAMADAYVELYETLAYGRLAGAA